MKWKQVNQMGKYQLDTKSKVAAAKYQDGKKPAVSNKKNKINQIREAYLQKKNDKKPSREWSDSLAAFKCHAIRSWNERRGSSVRSLCMDDPLFVSPFANQSRFVSMSRTSRVEVNPFLFSWGDWWFIECSSKFRYTVTWLNHSVCLFGRMTALLV